MTTQPEPVRRATAFGHTVVYDGVAGVSMVLRWTCTACGDAVLDNLGHIYGSAVDGTYCNRGQAGAM